MKKRVITMVLVLLMLAFLAFRLLRPQEPEYAGRPLSEWLKRAYARHDHNGTPAEAAQVREQVRQAVEQVGPEAIPKLAEWATTVESEFVSKLHNWMDRLPISLSDSSAGQNWQVLGATTLKLLGAKAKPAVPLLLRQTQRRRPQRVRVAALSTLGEMGEHAAAAVPEILKLLGEPDETVRGQAVMTLGNIGQHAELVVPRLLADLHGTNQLQPEAMASAYALSGFNTPATLPGLAHWSASTNEMAARIALFGLSRLGPEALLPITSALTNKNPRLQAAAYCALAWSHTNAYAGADLSLAWLSSRFNVQTFRFILLPHHPRLTVPILTANLAATNTAVRVITARLLAEHGTNAAPAIPTLRTLAFDENVEVRQAAATALRQIEPPPL